MLGVWVHACLAVTCHLNAETAAVSCFTLVDVCERLERVCLVSVLLFVSVRRRTLTAVARNNPRRFAGQLVETIFTDDASGHFLHSSLAVSSFRPRRTSANFSFNPARTPASFSFHARRSALSHFIVLLCSFGCYGLMKTHPMHCSNVTLR